jgi:hypothetical protein
MHQCYLIHQEVQQQQRKKQYDNHIKLDERRPSTPTPRPSSSRHRTNPLPPSPHIDEVFILFFP